MTRYILAFGMLGLARIAYLILAFGARFNRTDELPSDGEPERPVSDGIKQSIHGERK